jgi:hypothetical protein
LETKSKQETNSNRETNSNWETIWEANWEAINNLGNNFQTDPHPNAGYCGSDAFGSWTYS